MIQNILALIIVGGVAIKTIYSVYKSITTKDKSICGGCASCELKNELRKKGKLLPYSEKRESKFQFSADNLKYPAKG
ncbi:MAG TPA: hypothetical protein VFC65_11745 [Prolixibacteraceae bacterium]|nr:hypothetical protein [Prolixibacteraceae bacterium]